MYLWTNFGESNFWIGTLATQPNEAKKHLLQTSQTKPILIVTSLGSNLPTSNDE